MQTSKKGGLLDEKNCIVVSDGNVSIGAQLLLFVIPLVGYIYYFMKKEKEPICAKVGLILALFGTAVSIFLFMVR